MTNNLWVAESLDIILLPFPEFKPGNQRALFIQTETKDRVSDIKPIRLRSGDFKPQISSDNHASNNGVDIP